MLAFVNTGMTKPELIARLEAHYAADEIVQGKYWENGKGCAVGCSIHGDSHRDYESAFGIFMILAQLEDQIFEGLPNSEAKKFPLQFAHAVPEGADLSRVAWKFLSWLIINPTYGIIRYNNDARIQHVGVLLDQLARDAFVPHGKLKAAAAAAAYAADAAAYAADAAAYAATYAADAAAYAATYADAATYAADAATYATYAAYAAAYAGAADAAAYAADADAAAATYAATYAADAADAADADADARSRAYQAQRDKLLELLKTAPIGEISG